MPDLVPSKRNKLTKNEANLFNIDRVFENFFNDTVFPAYYSKSGQMKVDIKENDKEYMIEADLPGFRKDDVMIDYEDDYLTISANHDEEKEEKKDNYLRKERFATSMTRSFMIDDVDAEKIKASMDNGVLKISLPKSERTKPKGKKIDIT